MRDMGDRRRACEGCGCGFAVARDMGVAGVGGSQEGQCMGALVALALTLLGG